MQSICPKLVKVLALLLIRLPRIAKLVIGTLELVIYTESKVALEMQATDAEDWFVVSGLLEGSEKEEILGSFKVDEDIFTIAKANAHKCPRCWKFQANEFESTCKRCQEVVSA